MVDDDRAFHVKDRRTPAARDEASPGSLDSLLPAGGSCAHGSLSEEDIKRLVDRGVDLDEQHLLPQLLVRGHRLVVACHGGEAQPGAPRRGGT